MPRDNEVEAGIAVARQAQAQLAMDGVARCTGCQAPFHREQGVVIKVQGELSGGLCPRCMMNGVKLQVGRQGRYVAVDVGRTGQEKLVVPAKKMPGHLPIGDGEAWRDR